ncbi:MAG: hypothetical protein ABIJ96_13635 [Elusimicrobiota bacterium]
MALEPDDVENLLKNYRSELVEMDVELPTFYLEGKSRQDRAIPIDAEIITTPDLVKEIDQLWAEIEHRRIGPDPTRWIWAFFASVIAGAALGTLAVFIFKLPGAPVPAADVAAGSAIQTIPFPTGHTTGLAVIRGAFLSIDARTQEIITLDPGSTQIVRAADFPNQAASGLAAGDRELWSTDAASGWIYRHNAESFAIKEKNPSPGSRPTAILWDGTSLWTTDAETSKLYRHADEKGLRVLLSKKIADGNPAGLVRVGDHIWAAGRRSRTIHRYRIGAGLEPEGTAHIGDIIPAGSRLDGITVEGDWIWLLTDSPSELHRVPRGRIRFGS